MKFLGAKFPARVAAKLPLKLLPTVPSMAKAC
jgi:hypothetical protein